MERSSPRDEDGRNRGHHPDIVETYPAIEDHGLIGDLQTAALVTNDGTIDWFCAPRFDSPTIFASLVDHDGGGHFRVAPSDVAYVTKQLYLPGTPILITRFMSTDGVGEVDRVQGLAVDVELELAGRAVADADRTGTLVALEVLERLLREFR